jgi:2,4-dienoyl-CoA reductase-like NADH-dependent reductase (Old Yellow Enzyme family)
MVTMSRLFDSTEINRMKLTNRFVRSATWEGMASEGGACTLGLIELMVQLAQGGVGLIISSHAYIRTDGQASPWQLGVYEDELIGGLREMTRRVHEHGSRIALQITHGGLFANPKLTGQRPMAPSLTAGFIKSPAQEMSGEDIQAILECFSQAARRAKEASFDAVEIHAAHGYLLSQFLSPGFNQRKDAYGGTVGNRAKLLLDVLQELRATLGPKFPILVKINSQDFLDGGLTVEESIQVGALLQQGGIDAIELSGGTIVSGKLGPSRRGITSEEKEAYFREAARAFKEKLRVPLILVGGIRSYRMAEQLVEENYADYIAMSRPFIREPALVSRWASEDLRRAACLSDNQCFGPARAGDGIYCVVERNLKQKATHQRGAEQR